MASVARAIEQAASKSVNGDLWWEPHTALFYALDKCGLADGGGRDINNSEGDARLVSFFCKSPKSRGIIYFANCQSISKLYRDLSY